MDTIDEPPSHPPPPPPKRLSRPKITLQMPDTPTPISFRGPPTASLYWGPSSQRYSMRPPGTAVSHSTDPSVNPYFYPFVHMYHNKAQEFMFKQFAGFKDFTMNTAKSGLSAGEKTAFWLYNKLSTLSKRWFTHLFLSLCLVLYSALGALVFMAVEGSNETANEMRLKEIREDAAFVIQRVVQNETLMMHGLEEIIGGITKSLEDYEKKYAQCSKFTNCMANNNDTTWTFWNSMFYAGTIYTTIG